MSLHEDAAVSDEGLADLSVVESSNLEEHIDTPATHIRKGSHIGNDFRESMVESALRNVRKFEATDERTSEHDGTDQKSVSPVLTNDAATT